MGDHQHAKATSFHEAAHELEQLHLMLEVERHSGLIEHQQLWLLRERARDAHTLVLATGKGPEPPIGEVLSVARDERAIHGRVIFGALVASERQMRITPEEDRLTHALRGRIGSHRSIAKITFPIWLYVSVTGVVVYMMLYHGPAAT